MNDEGKKKNYWGALVGIIVGVSFMILFFYNPFEKGNSFESGVRAGLLAYSKTLPQRIDEFTVLDSLTMPSDKLLNYYYTISITKSEANYASISENVDSPILNTIKTSAQLEDLRKLGYTWHYIYYDKNGEFFHEYLITPDMYR